MAQVDRQQTVLSILQNLRDLDGLKKLFWEELNYERENKPLSPRQWPDSARQPLADDPTLFATGGEDGAFHIIYTRFAGDTLLRGVERPIVNQLLREHPYALFAFSNKNQSVWHFLNVKYDETVEKRRLLRRITVRRDEGLRTAAERLALLDLQTISPDLFGLSPLLIQQHHDEAFDVEKVTKDFYREIANWYFWALKHVEFPKDAPKEKDDRDHISVIRLITRLIFCWFIREKGLIPDVLFAEAKLAEILDGFAPGKMRNKDSVFYRAILQNLFFATLNTEMDQRGWRRADQNFMAHSLYRHKECFRDPKAGLERFKDIPFLNGGLFECLDRDFGEGIKPHYLRVDGFSDRPDSRPTVPDFLFFGPEQEVNLSDDYGDKKFSKVRVRGLIDTLNRYKFTIEENTPFDQEVALDPELCGKVFENLLAAYNPETGTTARKATGSFYTPREIVDYMVDEALTAYLKGKLEPRMDLPAPMLRQAGANERALVETPASASAQKDRKAAVPPEAENRIRALLAYDGETPAFSDAEIETLIDAIDNLKALDPAVGSGAFPMGILHKLVHVLGKLDPDNERWKAKQIAKLDDAVMREDAERVFRENYDNYGRKLYLIENCIYGVDIQPIAVQIAKMRFFISLVVDQKINPNAPNLGVRALPNLETKFVAANTLIGIERPEAQGKLFANPKVDKLKADLADIRHRMFTAKTTGTKNDLRRKDAALRLALAAEVEKAFRKVNEDETRRAEVALAKATKELEELQAKPAEWQITRMTNLFGEEEETRVDLTKETKRRLRDSIKNLEARLRQATQFEEELDATAKQLAAWDPYDQNVSADFFDSEWMFGLTGGFDVCIGNPPYVRVDDIAAHQKEKYRSIYRSTTGKYDLYYLFFEKALSLLHRTGVMSYISPNKYCAATSAIALRQLIFSSISQGEIVSTSRLGVFEDAANYPVISILIVGEPGEYLRVREALATDLLGESSTKSYNLRMTDIALLPGRIVPINVSREQIALLLRLRTAFPTLGGSFSFSEGLRIPSDYESARQDDHLILKQYQFERWTPIRKGSWISERDLKKVVGAESERFLKIVRDKIVLAEDALVITATLDKRRTIPQGGVYFGIPTRGDVQLAYVLGMLNAKLLSAIYEIMFAGMHMGGGYLRFRSNFLEELPFPEAERTFQKQVVDLVDRILAAKKDDPAADTSAWEREIDALVYKLYGLTEEEIRIVDPASRKATQGKGAGRECHAPRDARRSQVAGRGEGD